MAIVLVRPATHLEEAPVDAREGGLQGGTSPRSHMTDARGTETSGAVGVDRALHRGGPADAPRGRHRGDDRSSRDDRRPRSHGVSSKERSPAICTRSSTLMKRSSGLSTLKESRLIGKENVARMAGPSWRKEMGMIACCFAPFSSTVADIATSIGAVMG